MEDPMKTNMKQSMKVILLAALLAAPLSVNANWFGNNGGGNDFFGSSGEWKMGPNGPYYDDSGWPVWTPMYWMDEMMDSFDNNDNNWGGYGGGYNNMPYGNMMPYGYAAPNYGYGAPYGYPQIVPVVPAPVVPAPMKQAEPAAKPTAK
ncbi:PREDICTED: sulfur globule protein CV2-like [Priapulus caudatus]|uniref:Sulfur globule protein CV2-like n=1 Tax=Priapulus caudatus TaxID=37621 RepID=A0ABM1F7K7_PRICU|nr:PREDICTED: sulfur globule protein CV2-like [Priapulus caudatus]